MSEEMTDAEYRAYPAVNYSSLKHIAKSPLHYRHHRDNPPKDNAAFRLGRAVHCMVLEPFLFDQQFAVYEGKRDKRVKAYKEFLANVGDRDVLSPEEHGQTLAMAEAVNEHPWVIELLAHPNTFTEKVSIWQDTACECKAKLDIVHYSEERGLIVADLKTFFTTDPEQIRRQGAKFQWPIQHAHYLHGAAHLFGLPLHQVEYKAFNIIVESNEPHDCTVVQWLDATLDSAFLTHRSMLDTLAECEVNEQWPGRGGHGLAVQIEAPDYML
jgi:hypothetical protein